MRVRFPASLAIVLTAASGAAAQTPYLVKDVEPGLASSTPTFIAPVGDRVLFYAGDPRALWSSAGTADTTSLLAQPVAQPGYGVATAATVGERAYFNPGDRSLWKSDGTQAGTYPFSPIYANEPGITNGDFGLFFGGLQANSRRPVLIDGRTGQVSIVSPEIPANVHYFANAVAPYRDGFAVALEQPGMWLVDALRGRTMVTQPCVAPDQGAPTGVATVGERVFVICGLSLAVADGSFGAVTALPTAPYAVDLTQGMAVLNSTLFFVATAFKGEQSDLWRSNGTPAGTVPFRSIAPVLAGRRVSSLTVSNGLLYFLARFANNPPELWRTDGTAGGTFLLKTVELEEDPFGPFDTPYRPFAIAGGVIFGANTTGAGIELWKSDGTVAGTVALPEINPGPASSRPLGYVRAGSRVFFRADDGAHGAELWAIDVPSGGVAVDDVTVTEGDGPGTVARFVLRLESPIPTPVTVSYNTPSGSANTIVDYEFQSGTITFAPGVREVPVDVAVTGDLADERDESFQLVVTNVTGTFVADGRARAVIVDDDGPRIAVANTSVVEGDIGGLTAYPFDFPVVLTTRDGQPSSTPITVRGSVGFLTATEEDFPPPGFFPIFPVTFPAGTASGTSLTLRAYTAGDTIDEPNETFRFIVDVGPDAVLDTPNVIGTILDNDGVQARPPVEIAHGSRIDADLAPPPGRTSDIDFYTLDQAPYASYEIVADAVSGDALPLQLALVSPTGTVGGSGQPVGTGGTVSLRWVTAGVGGPSQVRVMSAACGSVCGADDTYRLRVYETTLSAARVNNSGSQIAVAILHNASTSPVTASLDFWRPDGTLAGRHPIAIEPRGTALVNTATDFAGFVGSLTVAHDAPYGALTGKVVSLDSTVGIGSDTPLTEKRR